MQEIKVNDEIRDLKTDVALGLTFKQLFILGLGFIVMLSSGFFLYTYTTLNKRMVNIFCTTLIVPFGFLSFFTWNNLNAYQFIKVVIQNIKEPKYKMYYEENEEYKALLLKEKEDKKRKKEKKS